MTVSCGVEMTTIDEFKAECESETARTDLKIFDQFLSNFKDLGIFGNAQTDHERDWVQTLGLEYAIGNLTEAGNYNEHKKSCQKFSSSLNVEILTSQVGFEDQFQDYIVGARVTSIKHEWIFDPSVDSQTFTYYASVSFRRALTDDMKTETGLSALDMIKGKLFYPLQVRSGTAKQN